MTGPGDPAPAPGWYPDPDGTPGYVRWWNGIGWSDVTTPAGPGVAVQRSPVLAPPAPERPSTPSPVPPPSSPRPFPTGWVVGLSVLALVAVLVIGVLVGTSGGDGPTVADPPPPATTAPSGTPFPPGTVRIIDEASRLSYPWLGENWVEWDLGNQFETTAIAGQYFTTQEEVPDGGIFIAQCTSGPLSEGYGWAGPSTLQSTVVQLADSVRGNYYPGPNERTVLRDEARTVDGHGAHLYEFQLSWDVSGYDSTGERAALLLVDVGRAVPALLYISIPNTHAELYGVIDQVLDDVQVL
ncbi:DUF2510 domain-containing protein [Geodermatophilus sp. SYSU D00691]